MRSFRTSIIVLMMVFVIAVGAMANDTGNTKFNVNLLSNGTFTTSQLDEIFPDSLSYYNTDNLLFNSGWTNFYAGVRFQTPADFVFQGVNIIGYYLAMTDNVNIYLYSDDNGAPDTQISQVWNGTPTSMSGSFYFDFVRAEADYDTIAAETDFWVIMGPISGNPPNGWTIVFDGSEAIPGSNMRGTSPSNLTTAIGGDIVMGVGGEIISDYINYDVKSLYNDIAKYHFEPNNTVTFMAKIFNRGNIATPEDGTAILTIVDSDENQVFADTMVVGAIQPTVNDSLVITFADTWTPTVEDRYVAKVEVSCEDGDYNESNNSYYLLEDVLEDGNWLAYDDGEFEGTVSSSSGDGHGVIAYPAVYPSKLDSASWYFNTAATNIRLQVFWYENNTYDGPLWDETVSIHQGWNTFAITNDEFPEGITITSGGFVGMYISNGTLPLSIDDNQPVSAENRDMPDVGFQFISGTSGGYYGDRSGNWGIRLKCSEIQVPEFVFPDSPVLFGAVSYDQSMTRYYVFENQGSVDGTITSVSIQGNQYDPNEMAFTNTFPMTVAANSVDSIGFVWTPTENTPGLTGGIFLEHNDPAIANPIFVTTIAGNAAGVDVISTDAIPDNYFLAQNHPNPFNPETSIQFGLPNAGHVRLTVYNVMGQEVARLVDSQMNAGTFAVTLDGSKLSSGIYFYSLEANGFHSMKKMSLLK